MDNVEIVLLIMVIATVICYFAVAMIETEKIRTIFILVWMVISCFMFVVIFTLKGQNEEFKKLRGKCPEYEKIENVYKLK